MTIEQIENDVKAYLKGSRLSDMSYDQISKWRHAAEWTLGNAAIGEEEAVFLEILAGKLSSRLENTTWDYVTPCEVRA